MADLAGVFNIVSRTSSLALELYKLASVAPSTLNSINRIAKSISSVSSTVKQIGTIIREDDSLPSHGATEALDDVLYQCNSLLAEIQSIFPVQNSHLNAEDRGYRCSPPRDFRLDPTAVARLEYLEAHLDSLRLILSVMSQTMYTAQSVIWAKTRPTISPQQAASAVANEKMQLEALVIEEQMAILIAIKLYHPARSDARLLMENDSSRSLVPIEEMGTLAKPADLFHYQETSVARLDAPDTTENDWLLEIRRSSRSHLERLLERWTRLRQLQERLDDDERRVETERRETLQPTVESDSEDEVGALPKFKNIGTSLNTPIPRRPGSVQPLFTDTTTLPIPVPESKLGPNAPISPASSYGVSPRSSGAALPLGNAPGYSPVSPRSSIPTLPVEAAAAIEAKEDDDDVDLEIPWTICVRHDYWDFVDNKIVKTNTKLSPPSPLSDRNGRTEILASWVCKEAIQEAGFECTKVQKDRQDGRRTKFETCFVIQKPLSFAQVQRLVERTVEIYRQNKPASPPPLPRQRRTSFDRPQSSHSARHSLDGDRTPLASQNQRPPPPINTYPPLDRSSSFTYPPPPPPPLDRSMSMPGIGPNYPPPPNKNPHPTNVHLPVPLGHYSQHPGIFPPSAAPYSPSYYTPPNAAFFAPPPGDPRRSSNNVNFPPPPPPLPILPPRPSSKSRSKQDTNNQYSSASTTSDEEYIAARRKERSRNRRQPGSKRKLAKVVGLAALLDGIVELGVL